MIELRNALSALKNYKLYSIINILGLAMSLACSIVLSRYIYREFTVDVFNEKIDRVYAEVWQREGEMSRLAHFDNPNNEAGYLNPIDHPAVEALTKYVILPDDYVTHNGIRYMALIYAVDSLFLPITDYPLAKGDVNSLFSSSSDAVISSEFAEKIFGDEDPMGKSFIYSNGKPLTVKGVLLNSATKRLLNYDVLISINLEPRWSFSKIPDAFILLNRGSSIDDLNSAYSEYKAYRYAGGTKARTQFISYKSLYFDQTLSWSNDLNYYNKGNYSSMIMLIVITIVVFFIGIFNFVNIYTVMLLKRGKEFGLKKVFGVEASYLFKQLILENMLLVSCSIALGWVFIVAAKDFLISLGIAQISHVEFDAVLTLLLLVFVSIITSLYPYIRYKKEGSIISMQKMSNLKSTSIIRSLLLMLQYVVSITMIIFSIYFVKQLNFMLNSDLGFNITDVVESKFFPENYVNVRDNRDEMMSKCKMVQNELNRSPIVESHYFGSKVDDCVGNYKAKRLRGEYKDIELYYIDSALSSVYDINAVNGRMPIDSIDNNFRLYTMWINESAAKMFDVKNLDTVQLQINQRLWWSVDTDKNYNPPYSINGVINDFKISHLRYSTSPAIYMFGGVNPDDNLIVRFKKDKLKEGIDLLKQLYADHVGNGELKYNILVDRMAEKYESDKLMATIFTTFAVIALIISSLGLFSLSLYDIGRRYREIALRRVCGAQSSQIIQMLLIKYMRQLVVSFVVASLLSYVLIDLYMKDFAERTPLSWWLFVVAALITALISFITLIWQTKKAADTNPAIIMKTE